MDMSSDAFALLRQYIRNACGLVLTEDKQYFIRQRLEPLAGERGCRSLDEFVQLLKMDTSFELRTEVIASITTNETSFFRDGHPWDALRDTVLPILARRAQAIPTAERRFRFWSCASATGQEAFSLAILIDEYLRAHPEQLLRHEHFSILATDISRRMVERMDKGTFSEFEVNRGLETNRREQYFRPHTDGHYVFSDTLRRMVECRESNLTEPMVGMGMFDLILCRNVLIYLDQDTKKQIFEQLYAMLQPDGWLMLGATENTYGITDLFVSERVGTTILYRKRGANMPSAKPRS